jgi:hypothetical protein
MVKPQNDSLHSETSSLRLRSNFPAQICRELALPPALLQGAGYLWGRQKGPFAWEFPVLSLHIREVGPEAGSVCTSHTRK